MTEYDGRTPTALPSMNSEMQSVVNVFANDAKTPNRAVRNSVALNAAVLPIKSEPAEMCVHQQD